MVSDNGHEERMPWDGPGGGILSDSEVEALQRGENKVPPIPVKGPLGILDRVIAAAITADQLLTTEFADPPWIVDGLLPAGYTLLAGKPKVGKSWLALQLAQAVSCGGMFLGIRCQQQRVLYLALEDGHRRLQKRMQAQGWPAGKGDCSFLTGGDARKLGLLGKGGPALLAKIIRDGGYRLVIIDTFSRFYSGDQNDVSEVTSALGPLQEAVMATNGALLVIDHHNKLGTSVLGDDPDPVTSVLGSTGKTAIADAIWGLFKKKGKPGALMLVTGRDVEERTLSLHQDSVTHCWQDDGATVVLTEDQEEALDALRDMGKATAKELADQLGREKATTWKQLQSLCLKGIIRQEGGYYIVVCTPPDNTDPLSPTHNIGQPCKLSNHGNRGNPATVQFDERENENEKLPRLPRFYQDSNYSEEQDELPSFQELPQFPGLPRLPELSQLPPLPELSDLPTYEEWMGGGEDPEEL